MNRAKVEEALVLARALYDRTHYAAALGIVQALEEALREAPSD